MVGEEESDKGGEGRERRRGRGACFFFCKFELYCSLALIRAAYVLYRGERSFICRVSRDPIVAAW